MKIQTFIPLLNATKDDNSAMSASILNFDAKFITKSNIYSHLVSSRSTDMKLLYFVIT
jgi:hypothetical protein